MTIKEFAKLCDCNPQTLRYYDHEDLLKPIRVDPWSGYRFYEEDQALSFVKIKNLQKAGFTIEEIKELLDADNAVIFRAFEAKIAEGERRLQEIRQIQQSYQTEMDEIQKKIRELSEEIMGAMQQFDPCDEFGIDKAQYADIVGNIEQMFNELTLDPPQDFGYEKYQKNDAPAEEEGYLELMGNPSWEKLYESHGWIRAAEYLEDISKLESGEEYFLCLQLDEQKEVCATAFTNTLLGLLLVRNKGKKLNLSCNIENSQDGQNHVWMFKRR